MKQLAVMQILHWIVYSDNFAQNHKVLASVTLKRVNILLKYGISKYSCLGFIGFAVVLCCKGDLLSYEIGKSSVDLIQNMKAKELEPVVKICFYSTVSPFTAPILSILTPLRNASVISLETGSNHFSFSGIAV